MIINKKRMKKDFDYITSISATETGCTRLSYSDEDRQVRDYIEAGLEEIGAEILIDSVGNIRAKYNPMGSKESSFLIGSHIDTVPYGGRYDGLTGVLASLEALRTIHENEISLRHPLELLIFAEEEGSNFGVTMIGSKYMAKKIGLEDLKELSNKDGVSAYDYIQSRGYNFKPEEDYYISAQNARGMIELHVEQGQILDEEAIDIGIVEAIAGMYTYQVIVEGSSNHAGTTPMIYRRDPLLGASEMIVRLNKLVEGYESAVITVGKIEVSPNASNVIASKVVFNIDIRDVVQEKMVRLAEEAKEVCNQIASDKKLDLDIKLLGSSEVAILDRELIDLIERVAKKTKLNYMRMNSGAVHDNAMLADIIPTAMIFLPSIGGISHSPYEDTDFDDIVTGSQLLLDSVIEYVG